MLTDLIIKNFAIIESLHVSFAGGFNVLTGETGAGKSIILDAVSLLLGGRARGEVIRNGTEEASVEAVFNLVDSPLVQQRLGAAGLAEDDDLVVRRLVSRSGKNRVFINGSAVTLGQLRELTVGLVNIYGQHEHQNLQQIESHLSLLDTFGGLASELDQYRQVYSQYQHVVSDLRQLDLAERERRQRIDMLAFQKKELEDARLQAGEDEELEQERALLLNAERLTAATRGGYSALYDGPYAVCDQLATVVSQLEDLCAVDPAFSPLVETLQSSMYALEDVATVLRDYAEKLEFEPTRQEQVEQRLAQLVSLKRKYAPTLEELIQFKEQVAAEFDLLQNSAQRREDLEQQLAALKEELLSVGAKLSEARHRAAAHLSQLVEQELAGLAMGSARFSVNLSALNEPTECGLEKGEFFLAANPGEPPQPLAKVASGGELSRIMLALRRSAPEGDSVRTLVFDEVDAGIGGEAATAVGKKIAQLGQELQVLCVTHLPQVAAFADHHYRVEKKSQDGRTATQLYCLDAEQRVREMARMLGGAQVGEQSLIHARELIEKSVATDR